MGVEYEWIIEEMDREKDEIVDVDHADSLEDALAEAKRRGIDADIALVREEYRDDELVDRVYAYVKHGAFPSHFEDGTGKQFPHFKVLQRFLKEAQKSGLRITE